MNRDASQVDARNQDLTRECMAFVLAGGRGTRLHELTEKRVKPAVYFGGKNRIIDFTLSNAVNSGIRRIGIATQYKAHSLIRHLQRGWNFFRAERNELLDILPASQRMGDGQWYEGTADAVFQNIDILEGYAPQYVIVLAGDHVYKQDYGIMLRQHVESGADVTVGCIEVPRESATSLGVMHVNETGRIIEFFEKPDNPPGMPDAPELALASMGIYVFETNFMIEVLKADAADPNSDHDFGKNIIPRIVRDGYAQAHKYSDSCVMSHAEDRPYWRDVGTVDSFWRANIDLTAFEPELDLYDDRWPIWTYAEITPPAKFVHDTDGRRGSAVSSLISGGCIISGASVHESLLYTGVRAHSFSDMDQVVALPYCEINRHAHLRRVVLDRGVKVPAGLVVGEDPIEDARRFRRTDSGVTLITQAMIDRLPT